MVVMEFVDGFPIDDDPMQQRDPDHISQLTDALGQFHAAGWVHGDLRASNLLVGKGGDKNGKLLLVDFDWAGQNTVARYPFYMNHQEIQWPQGATDGALILREHDLEWARKLSQ